MTQIYEGMFLLDNEFVREDWKRAKQLVTGTLEKHGAKVLAARRWDERRLAYPIQRRRRATYLLAYYEVEGDAIGTIRRDFDLSEQILRFLVTSTEQVPAEEYQLSELENSPDFMPPPPPQDDSAELEEQELVEVEVDEEDLVEEVEEPVEDVPPVRPARAAAKPAAEGSPGIEADASKEV